MTNDWPDRRPICRFDWSGTAWSTPANPRGWWMAQYLDARDPEYAAAFRKQAEPLWTAACAYAASIGAQIIYEHDPEGSEIPAATYRGHVLTESPPEQSLDFIRWRVAEAAKYGLGWGCTVRHTHYVASEGKHVSLAPPELTLAWELAALRRLGPNARFVYNDTNMGAEHWIQTGPGPMPESVYAKAQEIAGFTQPGDRFLFGVEFGAVTVPPEFIPWGSMDRAWGDPTYYVPDGVALAPWRDVGLPASKLDLMLSRRGGFDLVIPRSDYDYTPDAMARLTAEFRAGHVPIVGCIDPLPKYQEPVLAAWRASQK